MTIPKKKKAPRARNKGGRPSKINIKTMKLIEDLALLGLPDARIAVLIGVAPSTFAQMKKMNKRFSERIFRHRELAHAKVARALYERAVGYRAKSVKIFCSDKGGVTQVPFTEIWPPSETAAMAILKNRHPELWKDRQQVEHEVGASLEDLVLAAGKLRVRNAAAGEKIGMGDGSK